jgi:hypothetical protein
MRFKDFKIINEAQFNSKQEVIDHFVKQGKSAAAGASAWERGWRGHTPKKKELKPPVRSYHDDLDDKRYGETNEELAEAALGTAPKRPSRKGSRPERGHEPAPRYKKVGYCDACDRPKDECVCDTNLEEHKKGVRAHKYAKKAKGTINHLDPKKEIPGHKVVGPKKIQQLEKELEEAAELLEGAKVDRMVKHIAKSERKLGHSKEEAEDIAWATANKRGMLDNKNKKKKVKEHTEVCEFCGGNDHTSLDESGKASRSLCTSSKPDSELGASQLASCKSQGLRARDGEKSHKIGKTRIKVGGHRIKGKKYGGPIPDWSEE